METIEKLQALKFYGMSKSIEYRLSEAMESNLSYQDFLMIILEDESLYRKNKRCQSLVRKAKFNQNCYLEEFSVDPERGITKSKIQQLESLSFLDNLENLLLIGGTGAGKSFLAQAIGQTACLNGHETFFISANRLFKEIEVAEAQGRYLSYMNRLKTKVKLLIVDDFGLRKYSHEEASILYEVLEDRYRKGSLIVTSQVKPLGFKSLFEDQVISEAIVDRLTACSHTIDVKGNSFRGKESLKKE